MTTKNKKEFETKIMGIVRLIPRINFDGLFYLKLARESLEKYNKAKAQIDGIGTKSNIFNEKFHILTEMEKNHKIVIIFSAMFLEASIWDYGASNKSQNFAEKYFEKIDLVGKWLIIPKVVSNKEISQDSKAIRSLQKLVKARNFMVHSKSKPGPKTYDDLISVIQTKEKTLNISPEEAFQCIAECFNELQKIDDTWWLFYALRGEALTRRILLPGFNVVSKK